MVPGQSAERWLRKLTRLSPANGRGECSGKAPHKPLLLLCILNMVEAGEFPARAFTRSLGLVLRFRSYGSLVTDRWPTRLDLRLPFYHLSTQGLWSALDGEMRSARSAESCSVCEMDPTLYDLLANAGFRLKARMVLITKWFAPAERIALFESLGLQGDLGSQASASVVMEDADKAARRTGLALWSPRRVTSQVAPRGLPNPCSKTASSVSSSHVHRGTPGRTADAVACSAGSGGVDHPAVQASRGARTAALLGICWLWSWPHEPPARLGRGRASGDVGCSPQ